MELLQELDSFFEITEGNEKNYTHRIYQPLLELTYKVSFDGNNIIWNKTGYNNAKYQLPQDIFLKYIKKDIHKKIKYRLDVLADDVSRKMVNGKSIGADVHWDIIDSDNGCTRLSFIINPYIKNWFGIKKFQAPYRFIINIRKEEIVVETFETDKNIESISSTTDNFFDIDASVKLLIDMMKIRGAV
jgi:hypothetical protein